MIDTDGVTLADIRAAAINSKADAATKFHIRSASPEFGREERDGLVERMGAALRHRISPVRELPEASREFRGMSMIRMAEYSLRAANQRVPSSNSEIVRLALHSTSDFPAVLLNAFNKTLMAAYAEAGAGLLQVAQRSNATDFRAKHSVRLGEMPALEKVNESGEFKRGSRIDSKESYAVATYGKIFGITKQVIINDDLGAFDTMAGASGAAAMRFQHQFLADLWRSTAALARPWAPTPKRCSTPITITWLARALLRQRTLSARAGSPCGGSAASMALR